MRVSNRLEFTENHRYVAYRDFALSGLDRRILSHLYQPMVGGFAIGLYMLLYHHLEDERIGYTVPEPQRRLFLGLDLELNDAGRKQLIEHSSKLEAVGLLQVYRQYDPANEETLYEYVLLRPLSSAEFFTNLHLTLLLRDKVGKVSLLELKDHFAPERPVGLARFMNREETTVPFYELFRLNAGPVDPELEAALAESAPASEAAASSRIKKPEKIRHSDMLLRFPRGSANRTYVERLHLQTESMEQINYLAYKFDLEVPEICRLLDEDGIFELDGTLRWDELQSRANLTYRQIRKRGEERERYMARLNASGGSSGAAAEDLDELPAGGYLEVPTRFAAQLSIEQYNRLLRTEPYTRMQERYFPGTVTDFFFNIFEKINQNYKLPDPVVNVLFHYLMSMEDTQRLTKPFIDSIASNMLAKGIDTYDKAVAYVRSQEKLNETLERRRRGQNAADAGGHSQGYAAGGRGRRSSGAANGGGSRKPAMPVVNSEGPAQEISQEEREKMRELARKLQDKNR